MDGRVEKPWPKCDAEGYYQTRKPCPECGAFMKVCYDEIFWKCEPCKRVSYTGSVDG